MTIYEWAIANFSFLVPILRSTFESSAIARNPSDAGSYFINQNTPSLSSGEDEGEGVVWFLFGVRHPRLSRRCLTPVSLLPSRSEQSSSLVQPNRRISIKIIQQTSNVIRTNLGVLNASLVYLCFHPGSKVSFRGVGHYFQLSKTDPDRPTVYFTKTFRKYKLEIMTISQNNKSIISAEQASKIFVTSLVEYVNEEFSSIVSHLCKSEWDLFGGEPGETSKIPKMGDEGREEFKVALFNVSLHALPNLFKHDLASRIRDSSIQNFSEYNRIQEKALMERMSQYDEVYNIFVEAGLDPFNAVDSDGLIAMVYGNLGIEMDNVELSGKYIEVPDLSIASVLALSLVLPAGSWKKIRDEFEII